MLPLLHHHGQEEDAFDCLNSKILDLWSNLFEFHIVSKSRAADSNEIDASNVEYNLR